MRFTLRLSHRCGRPVYRQHGSFQRALSFSLRNCATLRSSGRDPASGGHQQNRTAAAAYTALLIPLWPHAPVFPGCQLRGLWSGKCTPRMENYHPQALDWTRTSDALTTRFSGPLSPLSYKSIYPDGSRRSTAAGQGREMEWERRAYTPTLPFSHNGISALHNSVQHNDLFAKRYYIYVSFLQSSTPFSKYAYSSLTMQSGSGHLRHSEEKGHFNLRALFITRETVDGLTRYLLAMSRIVAPL